MGAPARTGGSAVSTAVDVLLGVVFLVVGVWVVVFGASTALLARGRGRSAAAGFALGAAIGPFAWIWMWWAGRSRSDAGRAAALMARLARWRDGPVDEPPPDALL